MCHAHEYVSPVVRNVHVEVMQVWSVRWGDAGMVSTLLVVIALWTFRFTRA